MIKLGLFPNFLPGIPQYSMQHVCYYFLGFNVVGGVTEINPPTN